VVTELRIQVRKKKEQRTNKGTLCFANEAVLDLRSSVYYLA